MISQFLLFTMFNTSMEEENDNEIEQSDTLPVLSLFHKPQDSEETVSIDLNETTYSQINKICDAIYDETGYKISHDDLIRFTLYSTGIMHMVGKNDRFPEGTDKIVLPLAKFVNEECSPEILLDPNNSK